MSPWTALLESLHSALIDELNERLPDLKPELGMPMRQKDLALPASDLQALICGASFVRGDAAAASHVSGTGVPGGFALLALDDACAKRLGLDARGLWEALLKRAGREFMHRSIQPRMDAPMALASPGKLPAGFAVPGRIVWIPFRLHPGVCYLGLGA